MTTAVGIILGALITIYRTLPLIGIHVPELPTPLTPVLAFIVGLFTVKPGTPPTGSSQAVEKAQADFQAAMQKKMQG